MTPRVHFSLAAGFARVLVALSVSACQETVLLGSECASRGLPCSPDGDEPPSPPPLPTPMRDAEADASDAEVSPTSKLVLENPNFERNGGADGDIVIAQTAMEVLGTLFPVLSGTPSSLPGWYACWPLSVNTNSQAIEGAAQSMGDYLSITPSAFNLSDFVAVRQELQRPLRAGQQVHLQLQTIARNSQETRMVLEVRGNTEQCGSPTGTLLGRSEVIEDHADWSPICVSFVADSDFSVLMLKPAAEGSLPPLGQTQPTLLLDTIQLLDACP